MSLDISSAADSDVDALFGLQPRTPSASPGPIPNASLSERDAWQGGKRKRRWTQRREADDADAAAPVARMRLPRPSLPIPVPVPVPVLLHPFFVPQSSADDSASVSPSSSHSPASSSSSSPSPSSPPVLSPAQLEKVLTPTPYWSLPQQMDFDQIVDGTARSVTVHPRRRLASLAASAADSPSPSSEYVAIPRFALHDDGQHGVSISDHSVRKVRRDGYWEQRLRKLQEQQPNAALFSALHTYAAAALSPGQSPPSSPPPLFSGCTFYVDGRTEGSGVLSSHALTAIVRLHGGACSPLMTRTGTTHILACNLTLSKNSIEWEARWGTRGPRGRRLLEVVHPSWVTDSVRSGKRLPERDYRLIKDRTQSSLSFIAADSGP